MPFASRRRSLLPVAGFAVALALLAGSVGWAGASPSGSRIALVAASMSAEERAAIASIRDAFDADLAARAAAFADVDTLSTGEVRRLRRSLNAAHVRTARQLGIAPVPTDSALALAEGLAPLDADSPYYATRWGRAPLTPDALAALDAIGERFQERLAAQGLPRFRYTVSSAFRTAEHQDRLRGTNANASRSTSSHEFGTTFDIAYRRYQPILDGDALGRTPSTLPTRVRLWLGADLHAAEQAWAERAAVAHAGRLEAELGRALIELEDEGALLTIREVFQPCYHVTVAQRRAMG